MTTPYSNQMLLEVIAKARVSGMFSQVTTSTDGETATHSFSLATGTASANSRHRYSIEFGVQVPAWVASMHPGVCSELCQIAIAAERPLPNEPPTSDEESDIEAGRKMMLGRAIQNVQLTMQAAGKNLGSVSANAILEMADKGEIEESKAVQSIRRLVAAWRTTR